MMKTPLAEKNSTNWERELSPKERSIVFSKTEHAVCVSQFASFVAISFGRKLLSIVTDKLRGTRGDLFSSCVESVPQTFAIQRGKKKIGLEGFRIKMFTAFWSRNLGRSSEFSLLRMKAAIFVSRRLLNLASLGQMKFFPSLSLVRQNIKFYIFLCS